MAKAKRRDKIKPTTAAPARQHWRLKTWHVLLGAALALVAVIEVYGPAIYGPFVFDDRYLPFTDPNNRFMTLQGWIEGSRPLLMFSYWLNYQISGESPYL